MRALERKRLNRGQAVTGSRQSQPEGRRKAEAPTLVPIPPPVMAMIMMATISVHDAWLDHGKLDLNWGCWTIVGGTCCTI